MRAVFLDKDGTLLRDEPYNVDPLKIALARGAREALARLKSAGWMLVLVSNQSGVARGYFSESALRAVSDRIQELLAPIKIDGFYYCPHHPHGMVKAYAIDCDCRKPAPGLLLQASHELGIDLKQSWLIGDILNDVEAGRRAGCRTILLNNGNETEWEFSPEREPHYTVNDLAEAATIILAPENRFAIAGRDAHASE